MSAGFHSHTHCYVSLFEFAVELLRFFRVNQASFPELTCLRIYVCNLLEARMIVTTYNQHVRLLSSEPFGWFAPPKFTRAWEPSLLWNHYTHWLGSIRVNLVVPGGSYHGRGPSRTSKPGCSRVTTEAF